jgi:site-specific DNA recombinase
MDDTTAGPRVTTLQTEIGQLRARHHEITDTPGDEPAPPQAPALARLGTYIRGLLDAGTPAMRKAVIETLIAEIRITEGGVIPRIPHPSLRHTAPRRRCHRGRHLRGPVRAMVRSVGRVGLEPTTGGL